MRTTALAGVIALVVAAGTWPASTQQEAGGVQASRPTVQGSYALTLGDISRLKTIMNLTPAQERLWPAVDAALREFARAHASDQASAGEAVRIGNRLTAIALTSMAARRLAAAAMPLIRSLDEAQKRDVLHFVNSVGMGHLARAL